MRVCNLGATVTQVALAVFTGALLEVARTPRAAPRTPRNAPYTEPVIGPAVTTWASRYSARPRHARPRPDRLPLPPLLQVFAGFLTVVPFPEATHIPAVLRSPRPPATHLAQLLSTSLDGLLADCERTRPSSDAAMGHAAGVDQLAVGELVINARVYFAPGVRRRGRSMVSSRSSG